MSDSTDHTQILLEALVRIAAGRLNNGMPLDRETSRQIAREALIAIGQRWPKYGPGGAVGDLPRAHV